MEKFSARAYFEAVAKAQAENPADRAKYISPTDEQERARNIRLAKEQNNAAGGKKIVWGVSGARLWCCKCNNRLEPINSFGRVIPHMIRSGEPSAALCETEIWV